MKIVLVWREEACTPSGIYTYDPTNPFDGIEIFEILSDDPQTAETDEQVYDRLAAIAQEKGWKFHIEPVRDELLSTSLT